MLGIEEYKDFHGEKVGTHNIANIMLTTKHLFTLYFDVEKLQEDIYLRIDVDYNIDNKTFKFTDNYYDEDSFYLSSEDDVILTDKEKERCKEIMFEYVSQF